MRLKCENAAFPAANANDRSATNNAIALPTTMFHAKIPSWQIPGVPGFFILRKFHTGWAELFQTNLIYHSVLGGTHVYSFKKIISEIPWARVFPKFKPLRGYWPLRKTKLFSDAFAPDSENIAMALWFDTMFYKYEAGSLSPCKSGGTWWHVCELCLNQSGDRMGWWHKVWNDKCSKPRMCTNWKNAGWGERTVFQRKKRFGRWLGERARKNFQNTKAANNFFGSRMVAKNPGLQRQKPIIALWKN